MHEAFGALLVLFFAWIFIGGALWTAWVLVEMFGFWSPLVVIILWGAIAAAGGKP